MLKKLKSLSGMHGLDEFEWIGDELKHYSLLYGWNGTGKTTLSNIFYCLKQKQVCVNDFEDVTFKLETNTSSVVTQTDIRTNNINLEVFNEEFINSNVHFSDSGAEPIVMIGSENIKLLEEIELSQKDLDKKLEILDKLKKEQMKLPDTDDILTSAARKWRQVATDLSVTGDTYFGSVFKITQVRALLIEGAINHENLKTLVIDAEDEAQRRQAVKVEWKKIDTNEYELIDFKGIFDRSSKLLETIIKVSKLPDVEALESTIQTWIEQGVTLHESRDTCAFCENPVTQERLNKLKQQFTDSLKVANNEITNLLQTVDNISLDRFAIDSNSLMPSLRNKFADLKSGLKESYSSLNISLKQLAIDLTDKKKHLTDASKLYPKHTYPIEVIAKIITLEAEAMVIINDHNNKVANIGTENADNLRALLLSCVANHLNEESYFSKVDNSKKVADTIETLVDTVESETSVLEEKKNALNDQKLAVEKINGLLSNFFDNDKLCFKPIVKDGLTTYEIKRRGRRAMNLSEGEKSVFALAYFLVSLQSTKSSRLNNTTVVIDDPVDSQDSNYLFRTYGVIRRSLKDAQQIVILTHNFEFFNIIRDWFTRSGNDSALLLVARKTIDNKEVMTVSDLPALLKNYKTEYHYLFFTLFGYVYLSEPVDSPLVANISRKVLEYFSSFKWCCRNSEDFTQRIQDRFMVDSASVEDRAVGDAINKFVNEYSHALDPFRPIGLSESEALGIAQNTLKLIENADADHYNALRRQCNREAQLA